VPSITARRRPTSTRSSSRKRVQSARSCSETKCPGRSGRRAGGSWGGCSFGPGIIPHLSVETVDKSGRNWLNRRRLSASGHKSGGRRRARLYVVTRGPGSPRKGGMPHEIGAKSAKVMRGVLQGPDGCRTPCASVVSRPRPNLGRARTGALDAHPPMSSNDQDRPRSALAGNGAKPLRRVSSQLGRSSRPLASGHARGRIRLVLSPPKASCGPLLGAS
jgi:hypothetical protein